MPDLRKHPTPQQLMQYRLGKLPAAEFDAVSAHAADCAECRLKVENQPPDSFIGQPPASRSLAPTILPSPSLTSPPQPAEPKPTDDAPAELLASSKFSILGKLGQGGMGAVFKARHNFFDELVAIKVMNASVVKNPDARSRFLREMKAAGKLRHQHIVRALDAEQIGDLLVLVMEFVAGITLDRLVKQRGPLPVDFSCRCILQAALGLQHAHEKGMVHRDIKPANLMVTAKEKEVKVLDFGLVRGPREQMDGNNQTQMQTFMGTPEYVAPEQATDARSADIRSDVYSLGCTLYFLLAGRPPFQAGTVMGTIVAHIQDEAPPLTTAPRELWGVIAKMLAKKPAERYQTPGEVAASLQPFTVKAARSASLPPALPRVEPVAVPPETEESPFAPLRSGSSPERRSREPKGQGKKPWPAWAPWAAGAAGLAAAVLFAGVMLTPKTAGRNGVEAKSASIGGTQGPAAPGETPATVINSIGMKLVRIPAGTFMMGSPEGEKYRDTDEKQHEVEITKAFWLGAYEVTQKEFQAVMGNNPSYFSRDGEGKDKVPADTSDFPVENVSYEDAVEFCKKLTAKEATSSHLYRLPTEAEWEDACRGGTPSYQTFHFGDSLSSTQANFNGKFPYGSAGKGVYLERTTRVGSYQKNGFGLYDMHGNVWEWCSDLYDTDYYGTTASGKDPQGPAGGSVRVYRGGSWFHYGRSCRSAFRSRVVPEDRFKYLGFRVTLSPSKSRE